jgi:hypothetical protein
MTSTHTQLLHILHLRNETLTGFHPHLRTVVLHEGGVLDADVPNLTKLTLKTATSRCSSAALPSLTTLHLQCKCGRGVNRRGEATCDALRDVCAMQAPRLMWLQSTHSIPRAFDRVRTLHMRGDLMHSFPNLRTARIQGDVCAPQPKLYSLRLTGEMRVIQPALRFLQMTGDLRIPLPIKELVLRGNLQQTQPMLLNLCVMTTDGRQGIRVSRTASKVRRLLAGGKIDG